MKFEVAGVPAVFSRNHRTGRAELRLDGEVRLLQSPFRFSTHFRLSTRNIWREIVDGHAVEVEEIRPRTFGGFRAHSFVVRIDGESVIEASGK